MSNLRLSAWEEGDSCEHCDEAEGVGDRAFAEFVRVGADGINETVIVHGLCGVASGWQLA